MMLSLGGRAKNLCQVMLPELGDGVITLSTTLLSGRHDHESAILHTRHLTV